MIIDIEDITTDVVFRKDLLHKAENILKTQSGSLAYASSFGIDLDFFLINDVSFQNESLNAYIIDVLTKHYLTVADYSVVLKDFFANLNLKIGAN
ncbi:MAG: hypothetical protein LBU09_01015 [Endomicrobium sp.]|jgi:hypothetical protein|nr:hypothetical protein [Endomicrobium sp.]